VEEKETSILIPSLERATHTVALWLESRLKDESLTQAEAHIVGYLAGARPTSINDLHRHFGHRRSTLTSVLDRLERRGYARRESHPTSRRSVMVSLTPEGIEVGKRVLTLLHEMDMSVRSKTGDQDIHGFLRILEAIEEAGR
jgi:DNA-binding MarR family transcriptional regulator